LFSLYIPQHIFAIGGGGAMAGFCPNCGKPVEDNSLFCGGCGRKLNQPTAAGGGTTAVPLATPNPTGPGASVGAPSSPGSVLPPSVAQSGTPKVAGGCGKVLITAVVILALFAAAGIGGAMYLAYRTKKKIDEVKQAYKEGNLDKMAGVLQGKDPGETRDVDAMPNYPEYAPGTAANIPPGSSSSGENGNTSGGQFSVGTVVPMKAGLRITTAIQQSLGDYESMKSIKTVNAEGVLMDYSADVPERQNPFDDQAKKKSGKPKLQSVRATRKILSEDLQNAHEYAQDFSPRLPLIMPSTTSLGISESVLNDLKTKGESAFTYQASGLKGALGGLLGGVGGMAGGMGNGPGGEDKQAQDAMKDVQKFSKVSCTLKRADNKTYSFPVLMNGVRTQLPAVRARCKSDEDEDAEFYFLDDPQNPLSLTWKLGTSDRLQVIKLEYVAETPAGATSGPSKDLEQKLEKKEKVQIYGIYFDFASARIKPESKPTLDEIAGVMKAHPDWKLNVDGHTDNVGTDDTNLQLSRQRAASVKDTLVNDYHLAVERLDTSGYGASRPVETNTTMEGRARNRRVELSRE
jgi:outer membrane protein OmpA-like peptidoglycan-associated protein